MSAAPRAPRPPAAAALGAFALATGVLWLRFHAPPPLADRLGLVWHGDLLNYFVPMAELLARRLAAGELPLWNPDACSGIPLLATLQVGAFYPPSWLALAMPPWEAFAGRAFAECLLAGGSAALLWRAWGAGWIAASAGGVVFVFAALLGQTFWPPMVSATAWLPVLLLCAERIARGGGAGWVLALAAATALQVAAGFPQVTLYGLQLLVLVAGLRVVQAVRREGQGAAAGLARAGALAGGLALGAGLAAVQLLPTLELVAASARRGALDPAEVHYLNAAAPHTAWDFVRASLDPRPASLTYSSGRAGGYLGLGTLVLLALGVAASWRSALTALLVAAGALALWLSDAFHGALSADAYALYARLPVVGSVRTPERLRLVTIICAVALAVRGLDTVVHSPADAPMRRRLQWAAGGGALALLAASLAAGGGAAAAWRIGAAGGLAVAGLRAGAGPAARARVGALLWLVVILDLVLATPRVGVLRAFPAELVAGLRAAPAAAPVDAARLRAEGPDRVAAVGFRPRIAPFPLRRVSCQEVLLPSAWTDLHRRLTGAPALGPTLFDLDPDRFARLYDLTAAARIARARGGRVQLSENADALPRAYLHDRFEVVEPAAARAALAAGRHDPRDAVLVDRDPGIRGGRQGLRAARVVVDEPERVEIEVRTAGPALLVLTDTFLSGWEARVDGRPAALLAANGLHRAVAVGAGARRVSFAYRPASVRWGAGISGASAAVAALLAARSLARRRRLRAPGPDGTEDR